MQTLGGKWNILSFREAQTKDRWLMMLFARLIGLIIIRYSLWSMKRMGKVEEYEDS